MFIIKHLFKPTAIELIYTHGRQILNYSARFYKQLYRLAQKGYTPKFATVKNIVYRWDNDTNNELKIILPEIHFTNDENKN